jgi:hypothetical protein
MRALQDKAYERLMDIEKRLMSDAPNKSQWHEEALRAAYDSDVHAAMLMNLQPGIAVVQIPGPFPRGIPIQIPKPPERSGNEHLLDDSIERWGVPRHPAPPSDAIEEETWDGIPDQPSVAEDFDEQRQEQFLQQRPARRTRRHL